MSDEVLEYWYPLVGLRLVEERTFLGPALLERPTFEEWRHMERTDVAMLYQDDWARALIQGKDVVETLPVCLVITLNLEEPSAEDENPLEANWSLARGRADVVLSALWLHKLGFLAPPELFGIYSADSHGVVTRQPGWYRQEFPETVDDGYVLEADDVAPVVALMELVAEYRARAQNPSAELALDNLRLSHGWHLSPVDRLAVLFAGVETLFGGYRARDEPFEYVPMPWRAALGCMPAGTPADPGVEAFLKGPGRKLRNAVAHGSLLAGERDVDEDVERIRRVLRGAIGRFLHFCLERAGEPSEDPPMTAFNVALAEELRGR
jgi:hypothetical protein